MLPLPPRDRGPVFASIVIVCALVVLAAFHDQLWPAPPNRAPVDLTAGVP